jgi:nitrite reductase (NADH) large subunit
MRDTPVKAWICSICGYVHYGDEPPAECPMCGADRTMFELDTSPAAAPAAAARETKTNRYIILGAGVAGVSAAEAIRKTDPNGEILLISGETGLPYYRMNLTRYLAGELEATQLDLRQPDWYAENRVTRIEATVIQIHPTEKAVEFRDGSLDPYDKLILAVGASPFVPPIPGAELAGVTTLRTRQDAEQILAASAGGKQVVCIGGGLLGLETAGAMARRGAQVTVLESMSWLLPRQLNAPAAQIFQNIVEKMGITLISQAKVIQIEGARIAGSDRVRCVTLADGRSLPADLVVISAGVRSNLALAKQAGVQVNQGILVDDGMQTSQADIYAAGDVTEHKGVLYGLWAPAQMQGAVAGTNAAGGQAQFPGLPRSSVLKVLGIDLFSIGQIAGQAGDVVIEECGEDSYAGFIVHEGSLAGSMLLGDTRISAKVKKAVEERLDVSAWMGKSRTAQEFLEKFL